MNNGRDGKDSRGRLIVGSIIRYSPGYWFVAMVNECRARIEPLSPTVVKIVGGRDAGKSFASYDDGTSIGTTSMVDVVDESLLNEAELRRYRRLEIERLEMAVNPNPVGGETKTKKQLNEERLAKLKADKALAATAKAADKEAKAAQPKAPKARNKCKCGCGGETGGLFVPGHDARFKGLLLKIERGQGLPQDLLPEDVYTSYKWRKTVDGKGMIPTTNYKGEPHTGYDTAA